MPDSPEAGVAYRSAGPRIGSPASTWKRAIIWNARLPCSNPAATTIWPFASGIDAGVAAMCYLAIALWPLGEVDRAVSLVDGAQERLASVTHIGTLALCEMHAAVFELMRGDRARAAANAF